MIEFLGCFSVLISTKNGVVKVQLEKKETKKNPFHFVHHFVMLNTLTLQCAKAIIISRPL